MSEESRKEKMLELSIILPVYNASEYLKKCLDSILNQTYQKWELICVDDGSNDGAEKILDEYADRCERIVLIHQKNMGESNARNTGLRLARGQYIAFVDCDDFIEPDMYEMLIGAMKKYNTDIAVGGWIKETKSGSLEMKNKYEVNPIVFGREKLLEYIYNRDSYQAFAYMWDKVYRRQLLFDKNNELILFPEELQLGGDIMYLAKLALNARNAVYVDRAFYHYLVREDSGYQKGYYSKDASKRMDMITTYQTVIRLLKDEGISEDVIKWTKRFFAYHCSNFAEIAEKYGDIEQLKVCQSIMREYHNEYVETNIEYPDRIERFDRILALEDTSIYGNE